MLTLGKKNHPTAATISRLYDLHADELLGFFARRTIDAQIALDLVGETFATAFMAREKCRAETDASLRAWLFGIGRNLLNDFYRDGAIESRAMQKLAVQMPPLSDESIARVEHELDLLSMRTLLTEALAELSTEHREAVALRVIDERSYDEIADALGVSETVARSRVSRGLKGLREALEEWEDEVVTSVQGI